MNLDNLFQRVDRTGRLLQPGGEAGGHGEGAAGAAHAADGREPRAAQPLPGDPDLQQRPLHPAQPGELTSSSSWVLMLTSTLQQLAPASLGSGLMSQHQQAALLQAAAQGGPLPLLPLTTPTTSDPPLSSIDTIAPLQHTFQVHT